MFGKFWLVALALVASGCTAAGAAPLPSPTPTASPTPAPTASPSPSPMPTPTPAPTNYPCDGSRWNQAESIITGPADGIRATIAPTDQALFPCERFGELTGWSSVFVNLAHYPRTGRLGGEIVQLGIIHRSGQVPKFIYTPDNTGGGGFIELTSPLPQPGETYILSIQLDRSESKWVLRVEGDRGMDLVLEESAHWTDPQSAWFMVETYDHSLVRDVLASALDLSYAGEFGPAVFANCSNIVGAADGQGGYAIRPSDAFSCTAKGGSLQVSSR